MGRPFVLPDLGEGLVEAEIVKVLVNEGDIVREDAPLLEVETDKATVEIPSPLSGRVEKIHVSPNQTVRVGDVLVTFADATAPARDGSVTPPARRAGTRTEAIAGAPAAPAEPGARRGPVPATPSTRRLARELGVDLHGVTATGPGGRVTDDDVRSATTRAAAPTVTPSTREADASTTPRPLATPGLEAPALPNFEQWGPIERAPLTHLRRTIAERMALSAALVPHVAHFDRADITELDTLIRRNLDAARAQGVTLTLTSFLLKAAALALSAHPRFNASLDVAAGTLIL